MPSGLCRDHWKAEPAHGQDTPYLRLAELGGYVCLLGVDQDRNTMLHAAEEWLRLPYLRPTAPGPSTRPPARSRSRGRSSRARTATSSGSTAVLRESGERRSASSASRGPADQEPGLGRGLALEEAGRQNPAFVLCDNPDLRRLRDGSAPTYGAPAWPMNRFHLAVSAHLAGQCSADGIENALASGIDGVELDGLQGQAVEMLKPDRQINGRPSRNFAPPDAGASGLRAREVQ